MLFPVFFLEFDEIKSINYQCIWFVISDEFHIINPKVPMNHQGINIDTYRANNLIDNQVRSTNGRGQGGRSPSPG